MRETRRLSTLRPAPQSKATLYGRALSIMAQNRMRVWQYGLLDYMIGHSVLHEHFINVTGVVEKAGMDLLV